MNMEDMKWKVQPIPTVPVSKVINRQQDCICACVFLYTNGNILDNVLALFST